MSVKISILNKATITITAPKGEAMVDTLPKPRPTLVLIHNISKTKTETKVSVAKPKEYTVDNTIRWMALTTYS